MTSAHAEQVPAVNVPSEHDEAVHMNPVLPVWVHVAPLARLAVQPPALSALAITALASQGWAVQQASSFWTHEAAAHEGSPAMAE